MGNGYPTGDYLIHMSISDKAPWESLEKWSASVFLAAGGLLIIHTLIHGLLAYTSVGYPFHHEFPFGIAGMLLGFVALFGLYPQLATQSPKLVSAAAIMAGLGTVGWIIIGVRTLSEAVGVILPEWLAIFGLLIILGVTFGYLLFGIASLRTTIVSQTTALIILLPVLVMVFNISVALTSGGSREGQIIVAGGFALAHLAIGTALWMEDFPAGRVDSSSGIASGG